MLCFPSGLHAAMSTTGIVTNEKSPDAIPRSARVRVVRDGVEVYEGAIASLKRFKDDVREVREGFECGILVDGFNDVKVGDVIEAYKIEEVQRTLA